MCKRVLVLIMLFFKLSSEANESVLSADSTYKSSDSCIVFVTTRSVKIENGQHTFGNTIAKDGRLRFYNIYFKGAEQRIAPRNSLAEALTAGAAFLFFLLSIYGCLYSSKNCFLESRYELTPPMMLRNFT